MGEPQTGWEAFDIGARATSAWAALQRHAPVLFVGGFVKWCTSGGGGGNFGNVGDLIPDTDESSEGAFALGSGLEGMAGDAAEAMVILVVVAVMLVMFGFLLLLRSWFVTGWYRTLATSVRGGTPRMGDLASGGDRMLTQLGLIVLQALIQFALVTPLVGAVVAATLLYESFGLAAIAPAVVLGVVTVPVLVYVSLGLWLSEIVVALEDRSALESLSRSWELASGLRLTLFLWLLVFTLLQLVANLVGCCLLCVGTFVTMPAVNAINDHAVVDAFLRLTGRADPDSEDGPAGGGGERLDRHAALQSPWAS